MRSKRKLSSRWHARLTAHAVSCSFTQVKAVHINVGIKL